MMAIGFGLNFYGFFAFAAVWVVAYFVWASRVNAAEHAGENRARDATSAATEGNRVRPPHQGRNHER